MKEQVKIDGEWWNLYALTGEKVFVYLGDDVRCFFKKRVQGVRIA